MIDYIIQPVLMGGLVKDISDNMVKIHLYGRLGVITVPERLIYQKENLEPGQEVRFYFSYFQVVSHPYDYDSAAMDTAMEMVPSLLGGKLMEVNDTAVKVEIMNQLGFAAVPRRWVFTEYVLEVGQNIEFYLSPMEIVEKGK